MTFSRISQNHVIGELVPMSRSMPKDFTHLGERYLRSGTVEFDETKFDKSIWSKKACVKAMNLSNKPQVTYNKIQKLGEYYFATSFDYIYTYYQPNGPVRATKVWNDDISTWDVVDIPCTRCLVAYGNGIYVALAKDAGCIGSAATSTDGVNWTKLQMPNTSMALPDSIHSLKYLNGKFIAVGLKMGTYNGAAVENTLILTSPDGLTWTQTVIATSASVTAWPAYDVIWWAAKNLYVISCTKCVLTSPDAVSWTKYDIPSANANFFYHLAASPQSLLVVGGYHTGGVQVMARTTNFADWTFTFNTTSKCSFWDIIWDDTTSSYYAVTTDGRVYIGPASGQSFSVTDRIVGTGFTIGMSAVDVDDKKKFIFMGLNGDYAYSDDNCATFYGYNPLSGGDRVERIDTDGTRIISVANNGNISISTDGRKWTPLDIGLVDGDTLISVRYVGGYWIILCRGGVIYYTANATASSGWVRRVLDSTLAPIWTWVEYFQNKFVFCGTHGLYTLSTPAANDYQQLYYDTNQAFRNVRRIRVIGNYLWTVSTQGTRYSSDLTNWSLVQNFAFGYSFLDVGEVNGAVVLLGEDSDDQNDPATSYHNVFVIADDKNNPTSWRVQALPYNHSGHAMYSDTDEDILYVASPQGLVFTYDLVTWHSVGLKGTDYPIDKVYPTTSPVNGNVLMSMSERRRDKNLHLVKFKGNMILAGGYGTLIPFWRRYYSDWSIPWMKVYAIFEASYYAGMLHEAAPEGMEEKQVYYVRVS